jgi:hypothetical protein
MLAHNTIQQKITPIETQSAGTIDFIMDLRDPADVMRDPDGSVLVDSNEFLEDMDMRLGRANGNVFHRREGVDGIHDGQIMVRLKKKRWIVIDYSIIPTEQDMQTAALNPHVSTPDGAGRTKCTNADCTKVGVPVLLYDSEPNEPSSLYMRSGLCFGCQRTLNEKRRTQRKRKSDIDGEPDGRRGPKFKRAGGETMELTPDAIVIDGPFENIRTYGDSYNYHEIGMDLRLAMREATLQMDKLISAVSGTSTSSAEVNMAAAAAAAAVAETTISEEATNAAVYATADMISQHDPVSTDEITSLYHRAFGEMSKAIFLMQQWKGSWDSAVTAAVAQETLDPNLEGAVAAAASIAAAGQDGQEQNSQNMMSLLVAAEVKVEEEEDDDDEMKADDEHVEV